jgi:glutamyl-tRNA reductase
MPLTSPEIILIGLNHKTAPVSLRECLAFSEEETLATLAALKKESGIKELMVYSTCNRVEFLMATADHGRAVAAATTYISTLKHLPSDSFSRALYIHRGAEAVRHLFRVTSSLDSMILGEPQILGQIKAAYRTATVNKASGVLLNRLLHRAFFVAKKIRTETGIGDSAVSVSYAAIELARKIFGELSGKGILLIGAGEMAELAVEHLRRHRVGTIYVANRTFERGLGLAQQFGGQAIRIEEIDETLKQVDIVISSTGAPGYMITRKQVKEKMRGRRNRPIFLIDIAVPRDIEPTVNRVNNAYVYDIDDLKGVIDDNIDDRKREAVKGERIIDEATIKFQSWLDSLEAVPTIVALRDKFEGIARAEMRKTFSGLKHLSSEDQTAINRMVEALLSKILHDPIRHLKSDGCMGDPAPHIDMARKLFKLDE